MKAFSFEISKEIGNKRNSVPQSIYCNQKWLYHFQYIRCQKVNHIYAQSYLIQERQYLVYTIYCERGIKCTLLQFYLSFYLFVAIYLFSINHFMT